MKKRTLWAVLLICGLLAACTGSQSATQPVSSAAPQETAALPPAPTNTSPAGGEAAVQTLSVMTHDSFAVSEEVIAAFETANHAKVQIVQSGDTGSALNKAILSKDKPLADVFYGVDNANLSRALQEGIFEAYASPVLADIPEEFKLDPENRALPVDYGDVCLNYDIAYFETNQVAPPNNLEDLLEAEYRSLAVVQNPAVSSPGLAFLLATVGRFGADGYLAYWQGLKDNDVLVVNDWETAYNAEFTRAGGTRPIVVSYGSSPAFEVLYAEPPTDTAPTGVVTAEDSCFRQIEFVGILKGAANRDLAEKWVDFMLSPTFQEDVPLQMFVFPVNPNAQLSDTFTKFLGAPESTAQVSPDEIAANRETWIEAWTEVMLR